VRKSYINKEFGSIVFIVILKKKKKKKKKIEILREDFKVFVFIFNVKPHQEVIYLQEEYFPIIFLILKHNFV